MNLILAQGADHTKPENMAKILKVIEQERNGIADKMYKSAVIVSIRLKISMDATFTILTTISA